jgi:hypothetical protein
MAERSALLCWGRVGPHWGQSNVLRSAATQLAWGQCISAAPSAHLLWCRVLHQLVRHAPGGDADLGLVTRVGASAEEGTA